MPVRAPRESGRNRPSGSEAAMRRERASESAVLPLCSRPMKMPSKKANARLGRSPIGGIGMP